ncbi:hypothetical protein COT47_07005, partial [Candidatus Woesearchaeota archaeon CG08_land_8_20_14_0_20_43_7]
MKEDLFDIARRFCRRPPKGCDFISIDLSESRVDSIEMQDNDIDLFNSSDHKRAIIKVAIGKKIGIIETNILDEQAIARAIRVARNTKPLEYLYGFPSQGRYITQKNFDRKIVSMSTDDFAKMAKDCISYSTDKKTTLSQGAVSSMRSKFGIFNSNGLDTQASATEFSVYVSCIIKSDGKVSSYYDSQDDHFLFDPKSLCENTKKTAHDFLSPQTLRQKEKDLPIIITPRAASSLLNSAFLPNFDGKNKEKWKSIFCGKENEELLSDNLSIFDDGTLKGGMNSTVFDSEGTPRSRTTLIDKGILKGFIYDHNTALHAKTRPTGNATSSGMGFSNVILRCKKKHSYVSAKDALVIDTLIGAHTS